MSVDLLPVFDRHGRFCEQKTVAIEMSPVADKRESLKSVTGNMHLGDACPAKIWACCKGEGGSDPILQDCMQFLAVSHLQSRSLIVTDEVQKSNLFIFFGGGVFLLLFLLQIPLNINVLVPSLSISVPHNFPLPRLPPSFRHPRFPLVRSSREALFDVTALQTAATRENAEEAGGKAVRRRLDCLGESLSSFVPWGVSCFAFRPATLARVSVQSLPSKSGAVFMDIAIDHGRFQQAS